MSNRDYGVVEVIYLPTGEKRLIKWDRFNPEIHKQIGDIHQAEYAIHYNQPVHLQQDDLGVAMLTGQLKKEEIEQNKEESTPIPEETTETVENVEEKPEDIFDETVDLPIAEVEKLYMWQLRKYAKHRGITVLPKSTKIELVAQVGSLNSN